MAVAVIEAPVETGTAAAWGYGTGLGLGECTDAELVAAVQGGDQDAWEVVVRRYQPMIAAIARRHRLSAADGADVSQLTWTRLLEHADRLRDPRALRGWIATTATRACLEVIRGRRRSVSVDPVGPEGMDRPVRLSGGEPSGDEVDEGILRAERRAAVRDGLATLAPSHQELLLLLVADPPLPYADISRRTGLPLGSIGPTRARLLTKLRRSPAVRLLFDDGWTEGGLSAA